MFLMFSLAGCYYDAVFDESTLVIGKVSFKNDIQPIFDQECISCHSGSVEPDLTAANSFDELMSLPEGSIIPGDAEGSEFFEMLIGAGTNPMPPGGSMSQAKVNLVKRWIDEGALNN